MQYRYNINNVYIIDIIYKIIIDTINNKSQIQCKIHQRYKIPWFIQASVEEKEKEKYLNLIMNKKNYLIGDFNMIPTNRKSNDVCETDIFKYLNLPVKGAYYRSQ